MIISVAWWDKPTDFEQNPLHCLAAGIRGLGSEERMVFLLNDAEMLPPDFRRLLRQLNVELVKVDDMKSRVANAFPHLALHSHFELNCFVRWLFIEEYLKKQKKPVRDILIVDGDILFLVKPEELIRAFTGTSFVLQGCPALTFLAEPLDWLGKYLSNLSRFAENIEAFSREIWKNKAEKASRVPEPGDFSRNPLASDQDLISALIMNGLLPQDDIAGIRQKEKLYMAENPLYMFYYYRREANHNFVFRREPPGEITINGARISHLHFQTSFTDYCCRALFSKPRLPGRVPNLYAAPAQSLIKRGLNLLARKYYAAVMKPVERQQLYLGIRELGALILKGAEACGVPQEIREKYFPVKHRQEDLYSLRDIFSPESWWQKDVSISWQ